MRSYGVHSTLCDMEASMRLEGKTPIPPLLIKKNKGKTVNKHAAKFFGEFPS